MKNFLTNVNWGNWILLIFFLVMMCINIAEDDYEYACYNGFMVTFNMFLLLIMYERKIITNQNEQKEREEKIIEMLKEKEK